MQVFRRCNNIIMMVILQMFALTGKVVFHKI